MAARSCPKCGSTKIEGDECLHCGVYISKYVAYLARGGPAQVTAAPAAPAAAAGHMAPVAYKVYGAEMQFVELELAPGVAAVAEAGSMMYMEDGIAMTTAVGDGSQGGVVGAVLSAGKRMLAGEALFITGFSNTAALPRKIAFAAPRPGRVVATPLPDVGGALVAQKDAFLAAAQGVSIGIAFQKRLGAGCAARAASGSNHSRSTSSSPASPRS